jgi:phosphoglucomutase
MAAVAKDKGKSLYEQLIDLYVEFGLYKESLKSITKHGKSGQDEIKQMMVSFRNHPPKMLAGSKVIKVMDYEMQRELDLQTGKISTIALPKSDVLQFLTEDGSLISARPSGTEPKIKFYFSVNAPLASKHDYEEVDKKLTQKIDQILKDLGV